MFFFHSRLSVGLPNFRTCQNHDSWQSDMHVLRCTHFWSAASKAAPYTLQESNLCECYLHNCLSLGCFTETPALHQSTILEPKPATVPARRPGMKRTLVHPCMFSWGGLQSTAIKKKKKLKNGRKCLNAEEFRVLHSVRSVGRWKGRTLQ